MIQMIFSDKKCYDTRNEHIQKNWKIHTCMEIKQNIIKQLSRTRRNLKISKKKFSSNT
jgi:cell division protein FtsL